VQPPTSGVGPYYPEGQPPSYPGPGQAPYPPQPGPPQSGPPQAGFPAYPPPQQYEGSSTLPFPGAPGAPLPGGPPFTPGPPEKKRSVLPLVIGFLIALLLVGSGCFGGGYLVGFARGKTASVLDSSPYNYSPTSKATPPTLTSTGSAPASTDSSEGTLSGAWTGSYTCNQGKTGLVLAFAGTNSDLFAAFSFYALPENPTAKSGEYIMRGTYANGTLSLHGDHWIKQPTGYQMVDLRSTNVTSKQITGTVVFTDCSTFTVSHA
jgi:hypothetical protein